VAPGIGASGFGFVSCLLAQSSGGDVA
jgi:hypothetical protein